MPEDNKGFKNPFLSEELNQPSEQSTQGQPMYYPYPPMPPQENKSAQVSYNPPSQSFQPQGQSFEQPKNQAEMYGAQPEQRYGLNESGQEASIGQPIINSGVVLNNDIILNGQDSSQEDMIVHEPLVSESIFSAPTPVYNPEQGATLEESVYVQNEEAKEDDSEDINSFMSSMQSLYAAISSSDEAQDYNSSESESVSKESNPSLTATFDEPTNLVQNIRPDYVEPVVQPYAPAENYQSQDVYTNQNDMQQSAYQPVQEPFSNDLQSQSFMSQMLENQEAESFAQQEQQEYNQPSPPSMYTAAPHINEAGVQPIPANIQNQDVYSSSFESGEKEQPLSEDDEKDPQYWEFMNNLLERFDDGKVHSNIGGNQAQSPSQEVAAIQQNYAAFEQEPEPDQEPLANFGKNVEKRKHERIDVPRVPKFLQKGFDEEDSDENGFEEEFGEFGDKKTKRREAPKKEKIKKDKIKKEKAPKASKAPKAPKVSNNSNKDHTKGFKKFALATFPMKGDSVKEIIRKLVVIISLIVLIGCGIYFAVDFANKKQNKNEITNLAQIMESSEKDVDEWSSIRQKYPDINFPTGMQAKFADLYAINQDLVGWIRVDGLDIDLPVVQKSKDNDFYLKHNFNKEKSSYGTIFVNYNNNVESLDLNTVIFGHRMHKDEQMFTNLKEYATSQGFKKAPIIEFNTLYGNYKWKVYAAFITNGSTDGDNGYVFNYIFPNLKYENQSQWTEIYGGYIAQINQRAIYLTGVDIYPTDRILTLSTCTYEFDNARLVVVARMLRAGESTEVDNTQIVVKENPRYPQAWYDENGIDNPYKNAEQWKPTI
ncbi:MAG: class B sortase [Clostridia bacterium]|nr:class B sortase [Clostridia bacterium]